MKYVCVGEGECSDHVKALFAVPFVSLSVLLFSGNMHMCEAGSSLSQLPSILVHQYVDMRALLVQVVYGR